MSDEKHEAPPPKGLYSKAVHAGKISGQTSGATSTTAAAPTASTASRAADSDDHAAAAATAAAATAAAATAAAATAAAATASVMDGAVMGPPSIGGLLFELLAFYGHVFNPQSHVVLGGCGTPMMPGAVPPPGRGLVPRGTLRPLMERCMPRHGGGGGEEEEPYTLDPLVCIDPCDVGNNTGKGCYRISQIQECLASAAKAVVEAAEAEVRGGEQGADALGKCFREILKE